MEEFFKREIDFFFFELWLRGAVTLIMAASDFFKKLPVRVSGEYSHSFENSTFARVVQTDDKIDLPEPVNFEVLQASEVLYD